MDAEAIYLTEITFFKRKCITINHLANDLTLDVHRRSLKKKLRVS